MPSAAGGVIDRSVGHSAFRKLPTPSSNQGAVRGAWHRWREIKLVAIIKPTPKCPNARIKNLGLWAFSGFFHGRRCLVITGIAD